MERPKIDVLCTLGPASLHPEIVRRLDEQGVDLFRINLSHTPIEAVEPTVRLVHSASAKPICLDTEGPQVRCGRVEDAVVLDEGGSIRLTRTPLVGTAERISLHPPATFEVLAAGSLVTIDFDGVTLRVTRVDEDAAYADVISGGRVRSNRAVTVDPAPPLPALSEKDHAAIELGRRLGITHYALSFARSAEDVARIRSLAPAGSYVMAKIESVSGVRGMDGVISAADSVVIDRGDLSREIPLEYVPFYQGDRPPGQPLEQTSAGRDEPAGVDDPQRTPTVAEANDIANTLLDGVHGLVLAAETAIGIDPVGSVAMVARLIRAFEATNFGALLERDRHLAALPVD